MWKSKLLISWIVFRPTVSKTRCFGSAWKTCLWDAIWTEYSNLTSCSGHLTKKYTTIMMPLVDSSNNNIVKTLQGTCMFQSWPAQYSSKGCYDCLYGTEMEKPKSRFICSGPCYFFTSTKRFLVHNHLQYIIKNKKGWDAKLTHKMLGGSTLFLQSPQAAERGETKRKEN